MTNQKLAAIWARVSTTNQSETSLPGQISRAKQKLESLGYTVLPEYIKARDWASLELASCPEYLELNGLIFGRKIQAIGILNRDRLPANFDERLLLLSECKRGNVEIIPCEGPPVEDSDTGMLIEHILSVGKKQAVLRAQMGSVQGLHDRVTKFRKPVTYRRPYGYKWDKNTNTLLPDENWNNLHMITMWLLDGRSYDWIIKELKSRGVSSPSGLSEWNKQALVTISHSPTYAGKYYQLKSKSVAPKKRNGNTYGHTSKVLLPLDQAEYLPEVKIVNPPLTWKEHEQILDQIKSHQKLSKRNAKADYLLRGFIFCDVHVGKNGKPRTYHGRPHHKSWAYACPVGKCKNAHIPGPFAEQQARFWVNRLLFNDIDDLFKNKSDSQTPTKKSLTSELRELDQKAKKCESKQTKLLFLNLNKELTDAAFISANKSLQNEAQWIKDRKEQIGKELSNLSEIDRAKITLTEYAIKLWGKINTMGSDNWRELFSALHMEIHANVGSEIAEPFIDPMMNEKTDEEYAFEMDILKKSWNKIPLQFKFGVLLKPINSVDFELLPPEVNKNIASIVSHQPWRD